MTPVEEREQIERAGLVQLMDVGMTLLRVATPDEGAVSGPGDDAVTASFLIRLSVDLERARFGDRRRPPPARHVRQGARCGVDHAPPSPRLLTAPA